jgi:hypothetical protein
MTRTEPSDTEWQQIIHTALKYRLVWLVLNGMCITNGLLKFTANEIRVIPESIAVLTNLKVLDLHGT